MQHQPKKTRRRLLLLLIILVITPSFTKSSVDCSLLTRSTGKTLLRLLGPQIDSRMDTVFSSNNQKQPQVILALIPSASQGLGHGNNHVNHNQLNSLLYSLVSNNNNHPIYSMLASPPNTCPVTQQKSMLNHHPLIIPSISGSLPVFPEYSSSGNQSPFVLYPFTSESKKMAPRSSNEKPSRARVIVDNLEFS